MAVFDIVIKNDWKSLGCDKLRCTDVGRDEH